MYYHLVILSRLYAILPSRPHYDFMNLFDFRDPSMNSFNRKRRHIGIRIIIRIIYYPINEFQNGHACGV